MSDTKERKCDALHMYCVCIVHVLFVIAGYTRPITRNMFVVQGVFL